MGLPFFPSCCGLLSSLMVLLPIVTGIPVPQNSDLVRRYVDNSLNLFTGENLDFTSTQGSSDPSMFADDTNGVGDGAPMDWGLDDNLINLDGGFGNDALNLDDGSFQLAASFNDDASGNCQIRFKSGSRRQCETTPEPEVQDKTAPTPGPELVPIPQDPAFNCQIFPGCNPDGTPKQFEALHPPAEAPPLTPLDVIGGTLLGGGTVAYLWGESLGPGLAPLLNLGNQ